MARAALAPCATLTARAAVMPCLALICALLTLSGCSDSTKPDTRDTSPPGRVSDLRVESADSVSTDLAWTAPGDDGSSGRAASYDLRYARWVITGANWDSATRVVTPPVPAASGTTEHFTVGNLTSNRWYFAVKTADEVPNWSLLSNVCANDSSWVPDSTGADAVVAQANALLEQLLYDQINGPDPERPGDIDFREPRDLYNQALALDPENRHAHFGAAVTALMALSADPEVNAAFDEWKAYLDERVPFEVGNTAMRPLGVPVDLSRGRTAFRLPFDLVPAVLLATSRSASMTADPQISRVQAILAERVLPALTSAQGHLDRFRNATDYEFTVTGRMQGDEEADHVIVDRTDLLALRAGCDLLSAACRIAVSYELGLTAYDSLSMQEAMTRGSGWMALRSGGAAHMQQAHEDLLSAVSDLDEAIASLLDEHDDGNQDYDLIKIGPDDLSAADVESVRVHLPDVVNALGTGITRTEDWDGDPATPEVPLRIAVGALLSDPVPDWKELLPPYTVRVERRPWNPSYRYDAAYTDGSVEVPQTGEYNGQAFLHVRGFAPAESSFTGIDLLRASLMAAARARLAELGTVSGWGGHAEIRARYHAYLFAGANDLRIASNESYNLADRFVYIPVLTWNATEFASWTWPDPTLHGLLPDMLSTGQVLELFGYEPGQWEREVVLDWSGGAGDDEKPVPPDWESGPFAPQSSPRACLANLLAAWDSPSFYGVSVMERLLSGDFVFRFSAADVNDPNDPAPVSWSAGAEWNAFRNMRYSARVDSVFLRFEPGEIVAADSSTWTSQVHLSTLQVATRTEDGTPIMYISQNHQETFFFRPDPFELAEDGRPLWRIVGWNEDPLKSEEATWGRIKLLFR